MKTSELAKTLSRYLRKRQTNTERLLWERLRNRKFAELKFTGQHPIYYFKDSYKKFFIADFYCSELKLVLELDGQIHQKQKEYDMEREEVLKAKNLLILRFKNTEIETNIERSLIKLQNFIDIKFPSLLHQRRARDE